MKQEKRYKIVYCTPSLYMAGGVERVLTLKANYLADIFGYDITIITTDGKYKPNFFPLSEKVHVVNLDVNFEEMWHRSFFKRLILYLPKERQFKKRLSEKLNQIKPDITISLLRREINFLTDIHDGSKKIGEIHINRAHYRNFTPNRSNPFKALFAKYWMHGLVYKVKRLDRFVVLTEYDRQAWQEIPRVDVIPNPLPFYPPNIPSIRKKRIIAVGRYFDEKGYDLLLHAWSIVEKTVDYWELVIYGDGNKAYYERIAASLSLNKNRYRLNDSISDVQKEYLDSSFFVCTSRFDGFGMGIIEAMACGLPVVAFDCLWGPRSIITDGEDGLLVENGNIEKLAETMISLIRHPEMISEMGQNARKNVRRFNMDMIAKKWKRLFDSL
ncbi:MAG: glycosyltransferase family 4 protein [Prevotella sp.]|nr:glycosyltransferase family 4 protein [Prevotella sp.]